MITQVWGIRHLVWGWHIGRRLVPHAFWGFAYTTPTPEERARLQAIWEGRA